MSVEKRKKWRDFTSDLIKGGVVDAALILISQGWHLINVGPIKWISERIIEYLWDKTGDKAVRILLRKGWLGYDAAKGAIRVKKINRAKDDEDSEDYWVHISDI